jgi:hypothetical protein
MNTSRAARRITSSFRAACALRQGRPERPGGRGVMNVSLPLEQIVPFC